MLKGIDISNWQGRDPGFNVYNVLGNVDFVITKATGGVTFVDDYCDTFITAAKSAGKLFGFYHFANDNGDATTGGAEARFFYEHCKGYFGVGVPVLDWETDVSVSWVNEFAETLHELSGVWCWIYANPWRINQGGVNPNCARWVAAYPDVIRPSLDYDPGEPPETDGLVACWQFASDGQVAGYSGNLDINHYYGDAASWAAYAAGDGAKPAPAPEPEPAPVTIPPIRYRVYTNIDGWLPEMIDRYDTGGSLDTWAGNCNPITYLAMNFPGWYQVKTEAQGWLPRVTRYDVNDYETGCAGDGSPIVAIRCYYETPNPSVTGWQKIEYAAANCLDTFMSPMQDLTDTGGSGDDFAGNGGRIGAFWARVI